MSDGVYYIVRGAKMKCTKGTHKRKINLPLGHGAYVNGYPMMNKKDNEAEKNIKYFGICNGGCEEGEDIYLIGEDGIQLPPGKKCKVTILDDWMNAKEDTLVEGEAALTLDSKLTCIYGGIISFVTDGQNDGIEKKEGEVPQERVNL
ncbi:DUF4280 domain-containing protein [Clostridium beijerinckii]|uniref:DUF4280 domain-containing protein n=1 Tax=Clostridium beijerinckii TaxID=1520 RepID=UPI00156E509A|nr:DUF4280 domain-containing protein [Clostridium beijerinckii]NRT72216.1 hypothetical protein [Clostridium beijerinckii]